MRKITQQIGAAFEAGQSKKVGNTTTDGQSIWLHGHEIVRTVDVSVQFTLAGWNTPTTRERLQAANIKVYTRKGQAYLSTPDEEVKIDNDQWYFTTGHIAFAPTQSTDGKATSVPSSKQQSGVGGYGCNH